MVASSVSLARVKKDISAAFTDFSVFSASLAGSVSLTGSGLSFIDIHCFFRSVTNLNGCSGFRSPLPPFSLLGPAPLLGPWWPLPTASGVLFLDILSYIPSGPETKCWSPPHLHLEKRVWVCVLPQNPYGKTAACHQDHLLSQKMIAFFTSHGDIVKLGLENCLLSGAFLKTLHHIFLPFNFNLKYTDHFLELWLQL